MDLEAAVNIESASEIDKTILQSEPVCRKQGK